MVFVVTLTADNDGDGEERDRRERADDVLTLPPCAAIEAGLPIYLFRRVVGEVNAEEFALLVALLVMNKRGDDVATPALREDGVIVALPVGLITESFRQ